MIARAFGLPALRFNGLIGILVVGLLLLVAVFGPWLAPYDPLKLDLMARLQGPSAAHLLGADEFGRDLLSRLIHGARTSAWIAFATVVFAIVFGTVLGVLAGFLRGWTDRILMMVNDALLAFPGLLLALGFMAVFGASRNGIIVALGIAYMPVAVRVVRGTVLSIREREFVEASRVIGNSGIVTMLRHVLPNCLAPIMVLATTISAGSCCRKARSPSSASACRRRRRAGATCSPPAAPTSTRRRTSSSCPACASPSRCSA